MAATHHLAPSIEATAARSLATCPVCFEDLVNDRCPHQREHDEIDADRLLAQHDAECLLDLLRRGTFVPGDITFLRDLALRRRADARGEANAQTHSQDLRTRTLLRIILGLLRTSGDLPRLRELLVAHLPLDPTAVSATSATHPH